MRKLQKYYQFNIEIKKGSQQNSFYAHFTDPDGNTLPDYKSKLTPSQWIKAKEYLTRELVPFCGYSYQVKPQYQKEAIYKIT